MATPNMQELMEKAKEMQQQMQKAQQEIAALEVTGEAGGGLVKITMNGAHQVLRVQLSPSLMGDEADMVEDLVMAATNDAVQKIETKTKERMVAMAKEMKLPEGFDGNLGGQ